jgi:DNA-binding CsgD family transcriptional regulator
MDAILAAAERLARVGGWALDLRTGRSRWSDELLRLHGLAPGDHPETVEQILVGIHPEDRPRIAALLDDVVSRPEGVPAEGIVAEYRTVLADGDVREIRFLGRIEPGANGTPAYWLGSAQDVTEQRVTERELRVHYALSQALRDWQSFDEGVVVLLRRLGTALEFSIGTLWTWQDERRELWCRSFWTAPEVDGAAFEEVARSRGVRPGEGAPGRAWSEQRPVSAVDMGDAPWALQPETTRLGLRSCVAVPAMGDDGPIAALAFYSFDPRAPSARILSALADGADELGRFLARHRGHLEPRTLSPREIEVLRLAAEGCSGPEIAERLVLSPSTVKSHFENVYEKLGVGDRAAAVARALRTGLID